MGFENICTECGEPFMTDDSDANYCQACWEKTIEEMIKVDNKGDFEEGVE